VGSFGSNSRLELPLSLFLTYVLFAKAISPGLVWRKRASLSTLLKPTTSADSEENGSEEAFQGQLVSETSTLSTTPRSILEKWNRIAGPEHLAQLWFFRVKRRPIFERETERRAPSL
jgi:hypothetical protein